MYEDFKKYLRMYKRNFNEYKFNTDIMYRATCFRQFGRSYKWDREDEKAPNDYDAIQWEVHQYEQRIRNK